MGVNREDTETGTQLSVWGPVTHITVQRSLVQSVAVIQLHWELLNI